jgi:NAD(P)-dependent dehydrogenase (short-subunit alcohol dehydrogenase family)
MALVATSDLVNQIPFTLNPFKLAYGSMRFSFNAMKFGTELALSMITNEKEKVGSALESWNMFCLQYGVPATPFGAARGVYNINRALIALGQEMGIMMFTNVFSKRRHDFAGELALIVGSNTPLGANLALKLAASRAKVICLDYGAAEDEQVSKIIHEKGGDAWYYSCDVRSEENIIKVLAAITKDVGDITMYFNCYGFPDASTQTASARDIIDRTITANFFLLQNLIPIMKGNGKGHIVLMKSVDAMMRTSKQRAPTIIAQYGIEGLYASAFDQLRQLNAEKQVKATFVRVYPNVVTPKDSAEAGKKKQRESTGIFGDIDATRAAEFIVSGLKKGHEVFSTPYTAGIYETVMGAMPMNVSLKLQRLFYNK